MSAEAAHVTHAGNNTERHVLKDVVLSKGTASFKIPTSDALGKVEDGTYVVTMWVTDLKDGDVKAKSDSVTIKIESSKLNQIGAQLSALKMQISQIEKQIANHY